MTFLGARYVKADFQMHTPADTRHWRGPIHDSPELAAAAYVARCVEMGLKVACITDHNFASKDFLPLLVAEAARQSNPNRPLTIFPGFEIHANVGLGAHVIAIFDPSTDLDVIDAVLTRCGIGVPRFDDTGAVRSNKSLSEIIEEVQSPAVGGLVICPHIQANLGLFDNGRIAEWLQQDEFRNEDLLCVDVPKGIDEMHSNWQRLFRSGPDCEPAWRRRRAIACVKSSDAKAFTSDQDTNFIGRRHTWVRMSGRSIESLRQAFLDHESRISLDVDEPAHRHPVIERIAIRGAAFLNDLSLHLSPSLNTIIGGRGTGKSTLVEYLRWNVGLERGIHGEDARGNHDNILKTLTGNTVVETRVSREDGTWSIERSRDDGPTIDPDEGIFDIPTFFPVQVLGQREIYSVADNPETLTRIFDSMDQDELGRHSRRAMELGEEVRKCVTKIDYLRRLAPEKDKVSTELSSLRMKLQHAEKAIGPLKEWQAFQGSKYRLEEAEALIAQATEVHASTRQALAALAEQLDDESESDQAVKSMLVDIKERLSSDAIASQAAGEALLQWLEERKAQPDWRDWGVRLDDNAKSFANLSQQLQEAGVDPKEHIKYQHRQNELAKSLQRLTSELNSRAEVYSRFRDLLAELSECWRTETEIRRQRAQDIQAGMPSTRNGDPIVRIDVVPWGSREFFIAITKRLLRDGRRMAEDDWRLAMEAVHEEASRRGMPPGHLLLDWKSSLDKGAKPDGCPWDLSDRRAKVLSEWLHGSDFLDLVLTRVPDFLSVTLCRETGETVGTLESGQLSVGQKCTAVLAILMAQSDIPLVIDQPEDDLDNEFVYQELVPMLRRAKRQRQVIVVTHNANIPVNGDAELLVALEVADGSGQFKSVTTANDAIGSLDTHAVRLAVQDIMEGSEEAFRKRHEKYGF